MKASLILLSVQLKISTLFVVSHVLSAKMCPEWRLNTGFGTQKNWPFPLNKGVPSIEVIGTKIMCVFSGPNFVSLE